MTQTKNDKLVGFLTREAAALLERHGEDAKTARRGADAFVERLRLVIGSVQFYVAANLREEKKLIREKVVNSDESVNELAQRHGLSTVRIYQIMRITNSKSPPTKQNGEIRAIAIEVARMLITHGVEPEDAAQAASGFISIFTAHFARQIIYLKKGAQEKAAKKDRQIVRQYRAGVPIRTIAENYGVTIARVGQIIKNQGEISPGQKRSAMTLSRLKKSILEASVTYRQNQPNEEVFSLLMTAADAVDKARTIAAGNPILDKKE
jgi:Mor family transcriptional regulator